MLGIDASEPGVGVTVNIPKTERCCLNCACYMEVQNPINKLAHQGFCRRDPPNAQTVRVERPRVLPDGKPAMDKQGRPIMERGEQLAYVHRLTARELTCYDGWRPLGTRPGDRWEQRALLEKLLPALREVIPEELADALEELKAGPLLPEAANDH